MTPLHQFDNPILSQVCAPIDFADDLAWLPTLQQACVEHNGQGIAAPQIGIAKRAIFIRYGRDYGLTMVNPVLSQFSEEMITGPEGCLSYPGVTASVKRHQSVHCEWHDQFGAKFARYFRGTEAIVLQHEVDHLNGVCRVGDEWRNPSRTSLHQSGVLAAGMAAILAGGLK